MEEAYEYAVLGLLAIIIVILVDCYRIINQIGEKDNQSKESDKTK